MIIERNSLLELISELKAAGKKIVFTNGCFDIIHAGHVTYLAKAKELGDFLVIGLNSDDSVKRLKGKSRPVNNQIDRAMVIDALKAVDFVTIFNEDTPFNLINDILPDILVKGADYSPENVVGADTVINNGGKLVLIELVEGKSTTNIINKMKTN